MIQNNSNLHGRLNLKDQIQNQRLISAIWRREEDVQGCVESLGLVLLGLNTIYSAQNIRRANLYTTELSMLLNQSENQDTILCNSAFFKRTMTSMRVRPKYFCIQIIHRQAILRYNLL